jgi:hypothetical protein
MRRLLWASAIISLLGCSISLWLRLRAAQQRGDMYRDIAVRLDRQVTALKQRGS